MLMSSMAVMSSYAQSGRKGTASVIEKTPIEVVDGKFTPEIMLRLGRVSDPQLSPDGSKILYGVTYTSIEERVPTMPAGTGTVPPSSTSRAARSGR